MILKIFAIRDDKAEAYLQPFFMQTRGLALRGITELVMDPQHKFNRHPADFTLVELGEYDDANGKVSSHGPTEIINCFELKAQNFEEIRKSDSPSTTSTFPSKMAL